MGELVPDGQGLGTTVRAVPGARHGRTSSSTSATPRATSGPTGPSTAPSRSARSTTTIPTRRAFYFYAGGRTFRYDPASAQLDRSGPEDRSAEGAGRHSAVELACATTATTSVSSCSAAATSRANAAIPAPGPTPPATIPGRSSTRPATAAAGQLAGWSTTRWKRSRPLRRRSARPAALGYLDVRRRHAEVGRTKTGSCPGAACRPRPALAAPGQEGPAAGRLRLHLGRGLRGEPLPPSAAGGVDRTTWQRIAGIWSSDSSGQRRSDAVRRMSSSAPPWMRTTAFSSSPTAPGCADWMPASRTTQGRPSSASQPGTTARRTGPHDPAWYREGVPAADPAKVDSRPEGPARQPLGRRGRRRSCPGRTWTGARPSSLRSWT